MPQLTGESVWELPTEAAEEEEEEEQEEPAAPQPEPEPAAVEDSLSFGDGSAFGSDENLGFVDGPHDDEAPPPADDAPDRGAGRLRGTPGA